MKLPALILYAFSAADWRTTFAFLANVSSGWRNTCYTNQQGVLLAVGDTRLRVRNVDIPEALVFYDVYQRGDWSHLLKQCRECDIASVVIDSPYRKDVVTSSSDSSQEPAPAVAGHSPTLVVEASHNPPNPKDLWNALQSLTVQPKPFGGSSGFAASQGREPPRPPLPSRVVVLGVTIDHSRAARFAGTRVISLHNDDEGSEGEVGNTGTDDFLADAVLSLEEVQELWVEDLATPGSFWLNPPHPRDDYGNRIDPERIVASSGLMADASSGQDKEDGGTSWFKELDGDDEDELQRILADLSPL